MQTLLIMPGYLVSGRPLPFTDLPMIQCVKALRAATGHGLKESKHYIEEFRDRGQVVIPALPGLALDERSVTTLSTAGGWMTGEIRGTSETKLDHAIEVMEHLPMDGGHNMFVSEALVLLRYMREIT